jgi:predicted ATPase
MLKVVAEFASEAAQRTQVILATQSPELLDALSPFEPTVTVVNWSDGETQLNRVEEDELKRWLNEYTLGALQRSGELEEMA